MSPPLNGRKLKPIIVWVGLAPREKGPGEVSYENELNLLALEPKIGEYCQKGAGYCAVLRVAVCVLQPWCTSTQFSLVALTPFANRNQVS